MKHTREHIVGRKIETSQGENIVEGHPIVLNYQNQNPELLAEIQEELHWCPSGSYAKVLKEMSFKRNRGNQHIIYRHGW